MRGKKKRKKKVSHPVSNALTIELHKTLQQAVKNLLYIKQRVRVHSYGHTDRHTAGHGS